MSNKKENKSKIIYERLYKEYGEWKNLDEFSDEFNLSRQQINNRKNADKIDYDEIIRVFPEVNREWLYSDDIAELKSMPVKGDFTNDKYEKGFKELVDRTNEEDKPYNALDLLLEALEEDAGRIQDDLQNLVERIRKMRMIDRSDD